MAQGKGFAISGVKQLGNNVDVLGDFNIERIPLVCIFV